MSILLALDYEALSLLQVLLRSDTFQSTSVCEYARQIGFVGCT